MYPYIIFLSMLLILLGNTPIWARVICESGQEVAVAEMQPWTCKSEKQIQDLHAIKGGERLSIDKEGNMYHQKMTKESLTTQSHVKEWVKVFGFSDAADVQGDSLPTTSWDDE